MKKLFFVLVLILIGNYSYSQNNSLEFDSTLAKQLGADDYGMKMYVLVILKNGDSTIEDQKVKSDLFAGHMKNIGRLVEEGYLIIAGPFGKNQNDFRGLYLFDLSDLEEVKKLLQSDPAISSRLLKTELYPWYGSAALPMYLDFHEKIEKIPH